MGGIYLGSDTKENIASGSSPCSVRGASVMRGVVVLSRTLVMSIAPQFHDEVE